MSDFFNIQAISGNVSSTFNSDYNSISNLVQRTLPNQLFVIIAVLFAAITISRSYYQSIDSMVEMSPKLVTSFYSLSAWLFTLLLFWMAQLIQDTGLYQTQLVRWSLIIGALFMANGPFLLLPPLRKIEIDIKKNPILGKVVQIVQSKMVRYLTLTVYSILTIFQFFVAYILASLLIYGFRVDSTNAICLSFCYVMISLFYLYAFYFAMVKKEKKEEVLDVKDMSESISLLKKIRFLFTVTLKTSKCNHTYFFTCSNCKLINILDTKFYLICYLVLFVIIQLSTMVLEVYFLYNDFSFIVKNQLMNGWAGIIAVIFGLFALISHILMGVFVGNEAFRLAYKQKISGNNAILLNNQGSTTSLFEDQKPAAPVPLKSTFENDDILQNVPSISFDSEPVMKEKQKKMKSIPENPEPKRKKSSAKESFDIAESKKLSTQESFDIPEPQSSYVSRTDSNLLLRADAEMLSPVAPPAPAPKPQNIIASNELAHSPPKSLPPRTSVALWEDSPRMSHAPSTAAPRMSHASSAAVTPKIPMSIHSNFEKVHHWMESKEGLNLPAGILPTRDYHELSLYNERMWLALQKHNVQILALLLRWLLVKRNLEWTENRKEVLKEIPDNFNATFTLSSTKFELLMKELREVLKEVPLIYSDHFDWDPKFLTQKDAEKFLSFLSVLINHE